MGIFSPDPVTEAVEAATNENIPEDNWNQILLICDEAGKSSDSAKEYLRALLRRLQNKDPHIALKALTILDACVKNSKKNFHIAVASRDFENEFNKLMQIAHVEVAKQLRQKLRNWAENEFHSDPELSLIPSLYVKLKKTGLDFSVPEATVKRKTTSVNPDAVDSQEEEDEILKAIALSLKETSGGTVPISTASLYPTTSLNSSGASASAMVTTSALTGARMSAAPQVSQQQEVKKVRALYDFEAAEDNELTFNTGELIIVLDDSDPNWWKGSNQRGEGLFPANFVTTDLDFEPQKEVQNVVQLTEQMKEVEICDTEIDELKIDRLLHLFHEADLSNPGADTEEMLRFEREVETMGPLIDSELEIVDRKHAQLTKLSADLVEALGLYHSLMREPQIPTTNQIPYGYSHTQSPSMVPPPTSHTFNNTMMPHHHHPIVGPPPPSPAGPMVPPLGYDQSSQPQFYSLPPPQNFIPGGGPMTAMPSASSHPMMGQQFSLPPQVTVPSHSMPPTMTMPDNGRYEHRNPRFDMQGVPIYGQPPMMVPSSNGPIPITNTIIQSDIPSSMPPHYVHPHNGSHPN